MSDQNIKTLKWSIALVWFGTAFVTLFCFPITSSLVLLQAVGLQGVYASVALYAGIAVDVVMAVCTLRFSGQWLWRTQAIIIVTYTLIISIFLPEYWRHPFGPLLKNIPLLALLKLLHDHESATR